MQGVQRNSVIRRSLPVMISRKIGQIITEYAYLDYRLKALTWRLAGVSDKVGRLAMRDPRPADKLDLIRDLLFLQDVEVDNAKFQTLKAALAEIDDIRDLLAHGVWTEEDGVWSVVKFRGKVEDQSLHPIQRKRQLTPEGFTATPTGLSDTLQGIWNLISSVDSLESHATSPRKSKSPHAKRGRRDKSHNPKES